MKSKSITPIKKSMFDMPTTNDIEWVKVEQTYKTSHADEVTASFNRNRGAKNCLLLVTIGTDILELLKWKIKEKVCIYLNPRNPYHIKIVKSDKQGYTLRRSGKLNLIFSFTWTATAQDSEKLGKVYYEIMPNLTLELKLK